MRNRFKFNKEFGLTWYDRLDGTYYSILILVCLFFISLVFGLNHINFSSIEQKAQSKIRDRYKEFISEILVDDFAEQDARDRNEAFPAVTPTRENLEEPPVEEQPQNDERRQITDRTEANPISRSTGQSNNQYAALPSDEDYFNAGVNQVSVEEITRNYRIRINNNAGRQGGVTNFDPGSYDEPLNDAFNYLLKRRGSMYISVTDELINEPETSFGYRDPDEIERVVDEYQPMIEHCFRKASRHHSGLRGYVKVRFSISHEGYVLPESIKIISSNIRVKEVEQCIKNYIKRWRNFEKLDESMGIARVVQKFVFN